VLRNLALCLGLLVLLFVFDGCPTIVMNRHFKGQERMLPLSGDWRIGCPVAEAMTNTSTKKYWDSQEFWIYIPVALRRDKDMWKDFREIKTAILDSCMGIDSVNLVLLTSGDTLKRGVRIWSDSDRNPGQLAVVRTYGSLFKREYTCVLLDTLTIPSSEDSIDVVFSAWVKKCSGADPVQEQFEFRLYRQEGKKIYFDVGP
jgi:hypothetical protein